MIRNNDEKDFKDLQIPSQSEELIENNDNTIFESSEQKINNISSNEELLDIKNNDIDKNQEEDTQDNENKELKEENTESKIEVELSVPSMIEHSLHWGNTEKSPAMNKWVLMKSDVFYIINMDKVIVELKKALTFVHSVAARGGSILWVGPKINKQKSFHNNTQDTEFFYGCIEENATLCKQSYLTDWVPGYVTNFSTILSHISNLNAKEYKLNNTDNLLKKTKAIMERSLAKSKKKYQGIMNVKKLPDVILSFENYSAVLEAKIRNKGITVIFLGDTNTPVDVVENSDYLIAVNTKSLRAFNFCASYFSSVILQGVQEYEKKLKEKQEKEMKRGDERNEKIFERKYEGRTGFIPRGKVFSSRPSSNFSSKPNYAQYNDPRKQN